LKWQAFGDAVAQYLLIEDERERDHDVALRKAVSGMRTALLKASAGSALIRITRRSRFYQAWGPWKALSLQATSMRRLNRVFRRWVRTSVYGSFAWWRRVVVDAASAEEAQKRAARLFGQALNRIARASKAGAFVWWKLTLELENQRRDAMVAFGRVMQRWLRSSVAAAFVYWRRVIAEARAGDEARVHAANLLSQVFTRLAHKHTGGCFMVWKHALWLENQQKHATRLLEQAVARIGCKQAGFAFAYWLRGLKQEQRRQAALRAFDRSLRRWCRSSVAASFVFWQRVISEERASDEAQTRAARLLEQAIGRMARRSAGGAYAWWRRVVADARVETEMRGHAVRLLETSLSRMARTSVAGALLWWRRVAANLTSALASKHQASCCLQRCMRRWARASLAGAFLWWVRAASDSRKADDEKRLASRMLTRALERLSRKSSSSAFVFWRIQASNLKQIEDSWALGTRRMWRSFRRLVENRQRRFFSRWCRMLPRQVILSDPRERLFALLRRAVLRWEHTIEAAAFGCWRRRTASYSSRELSLHFLERLVRRHSRKSVHSALLAWRLRAKHTAVSAVAGAAKRRYEDFLRLDARCASLVAEAARRSEVQRLKLLLMRGSLVDAGLWMLAGRHASSRKRALRRGFDACGRALKRFRLLNRCARRLTHYHRALAVDHWRIVTAARTRAIAALKAYASHVGIRGRDNALRRALSRWCGLGVLGVAFTHAIDATCSIEVHTGAAPATAMLFVCNSKRWTRRQREQRPTLLRKSERHATRSTMR